MKQNKPKKKHKEKRNLGLGWIILLGIAVVFIVASVFTPQILNWVYSTDECAVAATSFEKDNLLAFYGAFLGFLGTVALGGLALWQNMKINEISKSNIEFMKNESVYTPISENLMALHKELKEIHLRVNEINIIKDRHEQTAVLYGCIVRLIVIDNYTLDAITPHYCVYREDVQRCKDVIRADIQKNIATLKTLFEEMQDESTSNYSLTMTLNGSPFLELQNILLLHREESLK